MPSVHGTGVTALAMRARVTAAPVRGSACAHQTLRLTGEGELQPVSKFGAGGGFKFKTEPSAIALHPTHPLMMVTEAASQCVHELLINPGGHLSVRRSHCGKVPRTTPAPARGPTLRLSSSTPPLFTQLSSAPLSQERPFTRVTFVCPFCCHSGYHAVDHLALLGFRWESLSEATHKKSLYPLLHVYPFCALSVSFACPQVCSSSVSGAGLRLAGSRAPGPTAVLLVKDLVLLTAGDQVSAHMPRSVERV